jgi:VWFA-related protein
MRILLPSCLIASAFAVPALHLAAQQPASTPPASTSRPAFNKPAREVILPVIVRDKHGDVVTNLTAADFTLTEDGRPQTIKSFTTQTDVPLAIGMLVDTSQTVEPGMAAERSAAEKFVAQILPADPKPAARNDQIFLLHFDNEVELLRDFTNSREKLDQELENMGPTSAEHNSPQGPETNDGGGNSGRDSERASHGGTQVYDAVYLASDELMKPKLGRKVLVVFSDGVDRSSKETQSDAIDAAEHANTMVYTIYFRGGDERQNSFPGMGRHGGMGGGGGYPGSGGGWPGSGGGNPGGGRTQQAPIDGKKVMQDIASRTGGQFFEAKKTANFEEIYNQIAKELQGQYVLSYVSDQQGDDEGTYHKVVLKPKRGDLTVITREGYYTPGGDSK